MIDAYCSTGWRSIREAELITFWQMQECLFGGVGTDALVDFYRVALCLFGLF